MASAPEATTMTTPAQAPTPAAVPAPGDLQQRTITKGQAIDEHSRVYQGTLSPGDVPVALKYLRAGTQAEREAVEAEVAITQSISHPNCIHVYGTHIDGTDIVLVTERCVASVRGINLQSTRDKVQVLTSVAAAMSHMHAKKIVHRDVACRNVLIRPNGTYVLADYGLARQLTADYGTTKSNVGPVQWMAPESIKHRVYSTASDVYMFGMFMYELFLHDIPWAGIEPAVVATNVMAGMRPPRLPDNVCPPILSNLIERCTMADARQRPAIRDVLLLCANYERIANALPRPATAAGQPPAQGTAPAYFAPPPAAGTTVVVGQPIYGGGGYQHQQQQQTGLVPQFTPAGMVTRQQTASVPQFAPMGVITQQPVEPGKKFCQQCGFRRGAGVFCGECGTRFM